MPDNHVPHDDERPSLAEIAALDAYLDSLVRPGGEEPPDTAPSNASLWAIAAQLRMVREGVDEPDPAFIRRLEKEIRDVQDRRVGGRMGRAKLSRTAFLRAAAIGATAAGLAGGFEADEIQRQLRQPKELVTGEGRWYDIAAVEEVASGQMKAFAAGGVLGYLVNHEGRFHAVSAICTHMGCRLKPDGEAFGLRCLCHNSRFNADGHVISGLAPDPLPLIALRITNGRIYAQGTKEDV